MSTSEGAGTGPAENATAGTTEAVQATTGAEAVSGLSVLDQLDGRPLHEHVAVYDELHARLQAALNRIDEA